MLRINSGKQVVKVGGHTVELDAWDVEVPELHMSEEDAAVLDGKADRVRKQMQNLWVRNQVVQVRRWAVKFAERWPHLVMRTMDGEVFLSNFNTQQVAALVVVPRKRGRVGDKEMWRALESMKDGVNDGE